MSSGSHPAPLSSVDSIVVIAGRWVTLRPLSKSDYLCIFRWRSAFEVNILNFGRRVATFEEFVQEFERLLATSTIFLVKENQLGAPIGFTMGYNVNQWDGWMFVGAYIEPAFRLRGHGGEASLLAMDAFFRMFPVRMVYGEVYEFSHDTLRASKAMGFEEVGSQPEHYWRDDRFWGLYRLCLTRERWLRLRERFSDILHVQEQMATMHR